VGRRSAIGTEALGARTGARRALLFVVAVCLIAAAIAWLPGLGSLRARFRAADPRWIAVAMALQLASVLRFVAALRGAFERRVSWRPAFDLAVIEQGANIVLPKGRRRRATAGRARRGGGGMTAAQRLGPGVRASGFAPGGPRQRLGPGGPRQRLGPGGPRQRLGPLRSAWWSRLAMRGRRRCGGAAVGGVVRRVRLMGWVVCLGAGG